jgi:hypothetical protein
MGATEIRSWDFHDNNLTFEIDWRWNNSMELILAAPEQYQWDPLCIPSNCDTDGHRLIVYIPKLSKVSIQAGLRRVRIEAKK